MKINLLMAAAIIGAGSVCAADVEVKAQVDKPKVEAEVKREGAPQREYKQEARVESSVKPVNKADSLIGMEVKNPQGERLGEVKDIVLDLPSGKISYVALAVGGFLGIGEKLVAVPAGTLTPSDHHNNVLVMDATRGEIVDAPGFAATNWPDHRNPNFNEIPFWRPKSHGSAATTETGRGKLYTDAKDQNQELKGSVKLIDNNTLVIDANGRMETFSLKDTSVRASSFKSGDRVTVKYHSENGRMIIDSVKRQ